MGFLKKKGYLISAIAGLVAVVLYLFLPALKLSIPGLGSETENGLNCMTGKDGGEFVIMMFIAVVAMVAGAVVAFLSANKEGDLFKYIAVACFVVGAIFCFLTKNFYMSANDIASEMKSFFDLGIGAILAGICSIVSAVAVILPKFLKD